MIYRAMVVITLLAAGLGTSAAADPGGRRSVDPVVRTDVNGDGRTDLAITGGPGWTTVPVAFSKGNGTFRITNSPTAGFPDWAQAAGAEVYTGDFNGDGRTDLVATGGPGWTTLPVAFSNGNGTWQVTNTPAAGFPEWTRAAGVKVFVGDVNGDGQDDLIATGGPGWTTVPVAFSNGDGSFRITNAQTAGFPAWVQAAGAQVFAGDFNRDGRTDLIATGGPGWTTLPVAFAMANGNWRVTNTQAAGFPEWTRAAGARVLVGDVNDDGRADLLATGGPGWTTVPVAFSAGDGSFRITNAQTAGFPAWTQAAGVEVRAGDFNRDGRTDLAATGGPGWTTLPVAFSSGNGNWRVTNTPAAGFPDWTQAAGVKVLTGDFNGDGRSDLAATGGPGWTTLPVAFSSGDGSFRITNLGADGFPEWSRASGATVF